MRLIETELIMTFPKMMDLNKILDQIKFFNMELNGELVSNSIPLNAPTEYPRFVINSKNCRLNFGLNQLSIQTWEEDSRQIMGHQRSKNYYQKFKSYFDFYRSILGQNAHFSIISRIHFDTTKKLDVEKINELLWDNFIKNEDNKNMAHFNFTFAKKVENLYFENYTFISFEDRKIIIPQNHDPNIPYLFNIKEMPITSTGVQVLFNLNTFAQKTPPNLENTISNILSLSIDKLDNLAFDFFEENLLKELGLV